MTTGLHLTNGRTADGTPQLTVAGEIDLGNAEEFRQALVAAITDRRHVLVDLTDVGYLDSAALAVLFAHADDIDVRVSPLNESLLTFSGLTGLTNVQVVR